MHGIDFKLCLGRVHCSHAATTFLDTHELDAFSLLHRWQRGDWGEVELNKSAQKELFGKNSKAIAAQVPQGRVVGIYPIGPEQTAGDPDSRDRLWISGCPFAGKGANTTILLMSEF